MSYEYHTSGTCSTMIRFDLDGDIVRNVKYNGGCPGNLKAIVSLVEGMSVEELNKRLGGITCGPKNTSCGDQLVRAVNEAYEKQGDEKGE